MPRPFFPLAAALVTVALLAVRVAVPLIGAGVRGEVRVRGIGSGFGGSAAEWTLGVSW
jgi:hypothetical protein